MNKQKAQEMAIRNNKNEKEEKGSWDKEGKKGKKCAACGQTIKPVNVTDRIE